MNEDDFEAVAAKYRKKNPAPMVAAIVGGLLAVALLWAYVVAPWLGGRAVDLSETEEDKARRAAHAQEMAEKARARNDAELAAKAAVAAREREAQEAREERRKQYEAMTPAGRRAELSKHCSAKSGACDLDELTLIGAAAKTDAERKALSAAADTLREAWEVEAKKSADKATKEAGIKERELFAQVYEKALLRAHRNPEAVEATGPEKKTLLVRGWFCSKQYLFDFSQSDDYNLAKGSGFTKLECRSASQNGSLKIE